MAFPDNKIRSFSYVEEDFSLQSYEKYLKKPLKTRIIFYS